MIYKEYKGSTPKYTATLRNSAGTIINPLTAFSRVVVKIYNVESDTMLIKYSSGTPPAGYYQLSLSSTQIKWAIPSAVSNQAEEGQNRVEIWVYYTDADIPDEGIGRECFSGLLNEFMDAEPEVTTTAAPTTTGATTTEGMGGLTTTSAPTTTS
jgi:hypothetical protein